jgi:hypothetical protein
MSEFIGFGPGSPARDGSPGQREHETPESATPPSDISHLRNEKLKHQAIRDAAITKWPHQIDWNLMRRFDERNGDYRIPEDASLAIMKCMLAIVQLRTHDPVVVQRMTGYPLRFISALVWNLLQNERWMCGGAYLELGWLTTAGPDGDEMLDGWLWSMLEGVWMHPCGRVIDLEAEWEHCTGVPIGF